MRRLIYIVLFFQCNIFYSQWEIIQMNQNELMKDMELTDSGIVISGFNVPNQLGTFWQISNLNKEILDMEVQQTTVPTFFDAISCVDSNCFSIAPNNYFYFSTNYGYDWSVSPSNPICSGPSRDVLFINKDTGFVGYQDSGADLHRTFDGGNNWVTLFDPNYLVSSNGSLGARKMMYVRDTLYCVGGGFFIFSTNLGNTWEKVNLNSGGNREFKNFTYKNKMFLVGQGSNGTPSFNYGTIARSVNGFNLFEFQDFPYVYRFNDIEMVTELIGYAVGKSQGQINCIYKTIDGGESWHPQNFSTPPAFSPELFAIRCIHEDTCFAIGNPGTILRTTNGGGLFADLSVSDINVSTSQIYPNPFENAFTIQSERRIKTVSIFDEVGRILYINNNPTSNSVTVDTKSYSSGIYIVKVETENNSETLKIVKK